MNNVELSKADKEAKNLTFIIYGLYGISWFNGITAIVAIIINYIKQDDMRGTLMESHFLWQMRTFWFGLLWTVIGVATVFILIGWVILLANTIWVIYRVVKGFLNLNDNKSMY
ncbi:MAG: hypothetical protein GQ569_07145 [Methylococcaceae bacterium]|nr:hypothetical protein [Methylococcaceae bacterium]